MIKRIIEIDPAERESLLSHSGHVGVYIRPAKGGGPNEFVIQTEDRLEHRLVEKLVKLFDISERK